MSLSNNLLNILKTGIALAQIYDANNWIEEKANQISNNNQRVSGLVDIAYHVGYMNDDTWQKFIAGLSLKASMDKSYQEMRMYCNHVVNLEVGKFSQLIQLPVSEGQAIVRNIFSHGNIYDQCAYFGLLMAKSERNLMASQLYDFAQRLLTSNSAPRQISNSPSAAYGKINNITLNLDVFQDGIKGLEILVHFNMIDSVGVNCEIIAWFEFSNGQVLKDGNGKYATQNGNVATYDHFQPPYENSLYKEFSMFLPYDEMHLKKEGRHDIRFKVGLYSGDKQVAVSDYSHFSITYR